MLFSSRLWLRGLFLCRFRISAEIWVNLWSFLRFCGVSGPSAHSTVMADSCNTPLLLTTPKGWRQKIVSVGSAMIVEFFFSVVFFSVWSEMSSLLGGSEMCSLQDIVSRRGGGFCVKNRPAGGGIGQDWSCRFFSGCNSPLVGGMWSAVVAGGRCRSVHEVIWP